MKAISIDKLEVKLSAQFGGDGHDPEFLARLPNGCVERRLSGFDSPTRAIDFSCPKPALFAHEQNFSITNHKKQCGEFLWPPAWPNQPPSRAESSRRAAKRQTCRRNSQVTVNVLEGKTCGEDAAGWRFSGSSSPIMV